MKLKDMEQLEDGKMSDALITIYFTGFSERGDGTGDELKTRKIPAGSVSVSGSRGVKVQPNANIGGPVEGATLSYENFKFNISGIYLKPNIESHHTFIDWDDILTLYKMSYNGTNAPILNIKYGGKSMVGTEGSLDIKVLLESPSFNFDPSSTRDAYLPSGTLEFVETA